MNILSTIKKGINNPEFNDRARKTLELMKKAKKAGFQVSNNSNAKRYEKAFNKYEKDVDAWKRNDVPVNVENAKKARVNKAEYKRAWDEYRKIYPESAYADWEERKKNALNEYPMIAELRRIIKDPDTDIKTEENAKRRLYKLADDIWSEWEKDNPKPPTFHQWATSKGIGEDIIYGYADPEIVKRPHAPAYMGDAPSKQRFITRYHSTDIKNLPGIIKNGLEPRKGGGWMDNLPKGDRGWVKGAFTEVRNGTDRGEYNPNAFLNQVKLEFNIPKEAYRNNPRLPFNPEVESAKWKNTSHGNQLSAVQNHGRTDIFTKTISPDYLKSIIIEDNDGNPVKMNIDDFLDWDCGSYGPECLDSQDQIRTILESLKGAR